MLTPMKGNHYFEENLKLRLETSKLMDDIKTIVKSETETDKIKVSSLRNILGLALDVNQEETDFDSLLNEGEQKH